MGKKRLLSMMVIFMLVFSLFQLTVMPVAAAENSGTALTAPEAWAAEDVQMAGYYNLVGIDLLTDYGRTVTREELYATGVHIYENFTGEEAALPLRNPFKDTDEPLILKAYELKLIKLPANGRFQPYQPVTKKDIVLMLYQVIKACAPELNLNIPSSFSSKSTYSSAGLLMDAVSYTTQNGLVQGKPGTRLSLGDACSRQELIVFAKKTYEFLMQETNRAAKGLLFKVSGDKSPVYVMGSIHITDASVFPFDNCIDDAFQTSDYLVVEANVADIKEEELMYMGQKALLSDGTTLDQHISPEAYELLAQKMEQYGITAETYNRIKPWYAGMLVQSMEALLATSNTGLGIDSYLLSKALEKEILEIEGLRFQVDMFDAFSPEIQEWFLLSSLATSVTESTQEDGSLQTLALQAMLQMWREGAAEDFEMLLANSEDSKGIESSAVEKEYNEIFWNARNNNMTQKIASYLADENEKTYFVVVGAGHLFGDTGVLKQLKELGYTVEQVLD